MKCRSGLKSLAHCKVDPNDKRPPMLRLLQDGLIPATASVGAGMVVVSYDQQWRTLMSAMRRGYVDRNTQMLTDAGRAFVAKATS